MTYEELMAICANASLQDWHILPALPEIGDELDDDEVDGGERPTRYETTYALYKRDLAVSLLWNVHYAGGINAPWLANMGEADVDAALVDVMYIGGHVLRVPRVSVDGGRCGLPMPSAHDDGTQVRYTVPRWEHRFLRFINALAHANSDVDGAALYDECFTRSGIRITD